MNDLIQSKAERLAQLLGAQRSGPEVGSALWRALGEVVIAPQSDAMLTALRARVPDEAQPKLDRVVRYARHVIADPPHWVGLVVAPMAIEFLTVPGSRTHVIEGSHPDGCAQVERFLPKYLGAQSLVIDARLYDATTLSRVSACQWHAHLRALNRGVRDPGTLGPGVRLRSGVSNTRHYVFLVAAVRYAVGGYIDPDRIIHPPDWPGCVESPARAIRTDASVPRDKGVLVVTNSTGAHSLERALRRGEQRQRCDDLTAFLADRIAECPQDLWYARGVCSGCIQLLLAGAGRADEFRWVCRPDDDDSFFADALFEAVMATGLEVGRMSACTPADYRQQAARYRLTAPEVTEVSCAWIQEGQCLPPLDSGAR